MNIATVGGDIQSGLESSVVKKICRSLRQSFSNAFKFGVIAECFNGKLPKDLSGIDLTIWMPDIPNSEDKSYPSKDRGSVLICSKLIHSGRTEADAVSRIFKMNGNAVICIYKDRPNNFRFALIDALGNKWCNTTTIDVLADWIRRFYSWSKGQIRMSFVEQRDVFHRPAMQNWELEERFVAVNKAIAKRITATIDSRYFGNFSTRCMSLFPSTRIETQYDTYLFSPRNVDKSGITVKDCVLVKPPFYYGSRKYSVDAPTQVMLYRQFDDINYMIHGHAFIKHVRGTDSYFPCGDLREVNEIARHFENNHRVINIHKHGFLIATSNLAEMEDYAKTLEFQPSTILTKETG